MSVRVSVGVSASARAGAPLARRVPARCMAATSPPGAAPWQAFKLPSSLPEAFSLLTSAESREALAAIATDPEKRNYWAYQLGRTAFFTVSGVASATLAANGQSGAVDFSRASADGLGGLLGSLLELYRVDLDNIERGVYRRPYDSDVKHRQFDPLFVLDRQRRLYAAYQGTRDRRERKAGTEMRETVAEAIGEGTYPEYYLQNFHYQEDGWLSPTSAKAYEHGTEALFQGSQDVMQRQALVPVSEWMKEGARGKSEGDVRLLEVAGGTGRFHTFIKDNWPRMQTTFNDLSPAYVAEARENLDYYSKFRAARGDTVELARTEIVQANAEALPFEDASFDCLVNVYLFHELPRDVRRGIAREMARVLAPGGLVVINDSLQQGDRADMDAVLPLFPANYHEPYYMDYTQDDLTAIMREAGLEPYRAPTVAHVSKVWSFIKPEADEIPPAAAASAVVAEPAVVEAVAAVE